MKVYQDFPCVDGTTVTVRAQDEPNGEGCRHGGTVEAMVYGYRCASCGKKWEDDDTLTQELGRGP